MKNQKETKKEKNTKGMELFLKYERTIQTTRLIDNFPILIPQDLVGLSTERITELADSVVEVKNRMQQLNMKGDLTRISAHVLSDFTALGRPDRK